MQGHHTGPFVRCWQGELDQAAVPIGRKIDCEHIHVLDLRDGQVIRHDVVRNDVTRLTRLGVFPPSPAVAFRVTAWKLTGRGKRTAEDIARRRGRFRLSGSHALDHRFPTLHSLRGGIRDWRRGPMRRIRQRYGAQSAAPATHSSVRVCGPYIRRHPSVTSRSIRRLLFLAIEEALLIANVRLRIPCWRCGRRRR